MSNPSVCGTLEQSKTEKVEDGELGIKLTRKKTNEVKNYYPKAITPKLFKSVQSKLPTNGKGGGARPTQNALSNLCKCPKCGSTMTRVFKGKKGGLPKLVCRARHQLGTCTHERFNQHEVENAMRRFFDRWDFENGLEALLNAQPKDREQLIAKIQEINKTLQKASKLPLSKERNDFMFKLLDERRKLELKTDYNIDISAKQFNESIKRFKTGSSPSEQNAYLRQIIRRIIIHKEDDLEVYFIGCDKKFRMKDLNKRKSLVIQKRKRP